MYESVIHEMRERILRNTRELDRLGAEAVHDAKEAISPLFEAIKEGDEND